MIKNGAKIKRKSNYGIPHNIYIFVFEDEEEYVLVTDKVLVDDCMNLPGWIERKRFKNKVLYEKSFMFKYETLVDIMEIVRILKNKKE